MTIYFGSSEDIDFDLLGTTSVVTTAGFFDSAYARGCIRTEWGGTATVTIDTALPTFYLTSKYYQFVPHFSTANQAPLTFKEGSTGVVRLKAESGTWKIQTWDGGWVNRLSLSSIILSSTLTKLTVKIVLHATSGEVTVWHADTLMGSWTGDTIGDTGATGIDTVVLMSSDAATNTDAHWSEVVIADEHTINMRVATLVPNADGSHDEWVNGWAAVDEIVENQNDLLQADDVNLRELMNVTAYGGSVDLVARRVFTSVSAIRGGGGPQNLQLACRHGTTDAFSGNKALSEVYTTYRHSWDLNPDTAAAWTIPEMATLQSGVKSIT